MRNSIAKWIKLHFGYTVFDNANDGEGNESIHDLMFENFDSGKQSIK